MFSDFKYIILWWSTFFIIGAIALPLTLAFFRKFFDKGYIFSKIIGSIVFTYLVFVLGVFKFVPFTSFSLLVLLVLLVGADLLYLKSGNNLSDFINTLRKYWRLFLFEELLFLTILTFWSFIRGFAPAIEGLEKFMDWGFVNSALRSRFMPPVDMWFSPEPINYYYFGHLVIAVLTKLSNINSAITYNLAIASTCALTFVSGFSLSGNLIAASITKLNLKNIIIGGIFSALLLTFGGNLHSAYKITKNVISSQGKITFDKTAWTDAANSYWYPDATRFIGFDPDIEDKTIHEFPIYSFVVADLHGHMNDIPNVILFVAVLLSFSLVAVNEKRRQLNWSLIITAAFLLSVAFMTNAWDFAVYGLVFAVFSFINTLYFRDLKSAFVYTINHGILIITFWYFLTIPFSLNFVPMAEGLKLSDSHTPFYQLFVLYGGFWLICLPFVIYLFKNRRIGFKPSDMLVLALIVTATLLIIIPEIGYIKDIYIYEHRRANTMFKLVYQAFMLYSLVSGYILIKLRHSLPYKLLFLMIFVIHLVYPFFAVRSYYGLKDYRGLWGLNFMKDTSPDTLAVVNWINENISGQPVILEAVGDSYTLYNQVSMATGLPTIEGWIVHEWLWRGGYEAPSARQAEVQKVYEPGDINEAKDIIQKYSVKYIFLSDQEREKYPAIDEANFDKLGARIIFESGSARLYEL